MSKNYDYELTYSVDRDGKTETVAITEVPYDVYKAAQPHFESAPEKALRLILNDIAEDSGKMVALGHIESRNLVAIQSIETGLGSFIKPIPGQIKKKSKSTKSDTQG